MLIYELAQCFTFHEKISEPSFLKHSAWRGSPGRKVEVWVEKVKSMPAWAGGSIYDACCAVLYWAVNTSVLFCLLLEPATHTASVRGLGIGEGSAGFRAMSSTWERVLQWDRTQDTGCRVGLAMLQKQEIRSRNEWEKWKPPKSLWQNDMPGRCRIGVWANFL